MSISQSLVVLSAAAAAFGQILAPNLAQSSPVICTDFTAPVTVNATNFVVQSATTNITSVAPSSFVSGTYKISMTYCEPAAQYVNATRSQTLQILVHGVTVSI